MNNEVKDSNTSFWLSTYGILTSQRILEGFKIKLTAAEITASIQNPHSLYHQFLRIPVKNVFNGIILQQAQDYQIFVQKIFIDYLISGQADKDESSPGASTREILNEEREYLLTLGEDFSKIESEHGRLIANSQKQLIELAAEFQKIFGTVGKDIQKILKSQKIAKSEVEIKQLLQAALIYDEDNEKFSNEFWGKLEKSAGITINEKLRAELLKAFKPFQTLKEDMQTTLNTYIQKVEEKSIEQRGYRTKFSELILRVNQLIKQLPDYRPDEEQNAENRAAVDFDTSVPG